MEKLLYAASLGSGALLLTWLIGQQMSSAGATVLFCGVSAVVLLFW